MFRNKRWVLTALVLGLGLPCIGTSQPPREPQQVAVAETQLLMAGLTAPNFNGLSEKLANRPTDEEAWVYARGQALLIAETGNLLMLRPPRQQGRQEWLERSEEIRTVSEKLGRRLAAKDYIGSRTEMANLANSCNRCHRTFQIPVQVTPFAER